LLALQELVYKQGQAGVTRASVTICFNNKDKKGSPVGYESYDEISVCRQVAIGGRNKYLINGHVAQQNKVFYYWLYYWLHYKVYGVLHSFILIRIVKRKHSMCPI
jgi:hypothetical protein